MLMRVVDPTSAGRLIEPTVYGDQRDFFMESYRENVLAELGVADHFVQDNHSRSARGVVGGMHFAVGDGQAGSRAPPSRS